MSRPRPDLQRSIESTDPGARLVPLAGDASTRLFFRLVRRDGSSRVVMDYGSPFDTETDDVRLARIFESASLPIARIVHVVPAVGYLVLEDLGDRTLESALAEGPGDLAGHEALYRAAVELCVAIATRGTRVLEQSERSGGPALDSARFRFEMEFFLEHYARGLMGLRSIPDSLRATLMDLADLAADGPRVLCHRDFHSRNLMVVEGGGLAMVDIQDARWGPDTYDLASLLWDAYVEVDEDLARRMLDLYKDTLREEASPGLEVRYRQVATQRIVKALGTFGYQTHVLGRRRYASAIHRGLRLVSRDDAMGGVTSVVAEELNRAGLLEPPSNL